MKTSRAGALLSALLLIAAAATAQRPATLEIDAQRTIAQVSPKLYGLMTEEINHSYDGGLYAELIRNRAFLDSTNSAVHWSVVNGDGAEAAIALDRENPCNDQLTTSLRLEVKRASGEHPAG